MDYTLLVNQLTCDFGFDEPEEMVDSYMSDGGIMPGICTNDGCGYSTEYEPDQEAGHCEACDTLTVVSAAIMLGVI